LVSYGLGKKVDHDFVPRYGVHKLHWTKKKPTSVAKRLTDQQIVK